eukprot:NODE_2490_length_1188_cov_35.201054_g2273_i0.p1 GENE.NODE_2490_length_1188_cov_35.201054_g2273_i0~~NODE_2490_length_1188_cov_35.201054_g2273_i0.p1  ORF type:complete len:342 (-),score=67.75 NODE_2490_length_1188_cov_35.201054_g2273_i0:162-1121(-)
MADPPHPKKPRRTRQWDDAPEDDDSPNANQSASVLHLPHSSGLASTTYTLPDTDSGSKKAAFSSQRPAGNEAVTSANLDLSILQNRHAFMRAATLREVFEETGCKVTLKIGVNGKVVLALSASDPEIYSKGLERIREIASKPLACAKVYVAGMVSAPPEFNLTTRLLGPEKQFTNFIAQAAGNACEVHLNGAGSGTVHPLTGFETTELLHFLIVSNSETSTTVAKLLALDLVCSVQEQFESFMRGYVARPQCVAIVPVPGQLRASLLPRAAPAGAALNPSSSTPMSASCAISSSPEPSQDEEMPPPPPRGRASSCKFTE